MSLDTTIPEVRFALEAVRRASELAERVRAEQAGASFCKGDGTPVTVADYAVQALIGGLLAEAFPSDPLVAEEDATALRGPEGKGTLARVTEYVGRILPGVTPESICAWVDRGRGAPGPTARLWTLDPVDGTKGFLRGGQYAVALALMLEGEVGLGVLGCPNLRDGVRPETDGPGSLLVALRGQGAWVSPLRSSGNFARLRVSACTEPARARLLRSVEAEHTDVALTDALARLLKIQAAPILMDSQAKYAVLAAAGGDLLVRLPSPHAPGYREKIWDQAAGSLVVEEAGGRITDAAGKALDFRAGRTLSRNCGVLASNGRLHPALLEALARLRHEARGTSGLTGGGAVP